MKTCSFFATVLLLSATSLTTVAQELEAAGTTKFKTFYTDSVDFSNQPERINNQFHPSNVSVKDGNLVFSINKHGDEKLLDEVYLVDYVRVWQQKK